MSERVPPHNIEAEESLLGAMLMSTEAIQVAREHVTSADFWGQTNASVFEAIEELHLAGRAVDPVTVIDELRRRDAQAQTLHQIVALAANVPSIANAGHYAAVVEQRSVLRNLIGVGQSITNMAYESPSDVGGALEQAKALVAGVEGPLNDVDPGDREIADWLADPVRQMLEPIIPGFIGRRERMMIVAPEGVGKSELTRQIAVMSAFGLHPLSFRPMEPIPVLVVDLENPEGLLHDRMNHMVSAAVQQTTHREDWPQRQAITLWHQEGGIDIRTRRDRGQFEDILRRRRPALVVISPIYKGYKSKARESDEDVANEVREILDEWRTRFDCALIVEHHAPHANHGVRDLRPIGSSVWMRWPEYGPALIPVGKTKPVVKMEFTRWRPDRCETMWPKFIERDPRQRVAVDADVARREEAMKPHVHSTACVQRTADSFEFVCEEGKPKGRAVPTPAQPSPPEEKFASQLELAELPPAQREVVFHPGRRWRFDFCWAKAMLAIEIEGGIWSAGRHVRPQGFENDAEKYLEATLAGWRVLRVTTAMVDDGRALAAAERALERWMP